MAGKVLELKVAGCPCTIQAVEGEWEVVFAAASIARSADLMRAIELASGGLVSSGDATAVANAVRRRVGDRSGSG